jgi:hypothetical protein
MLLPLSILLLAPCCCRGVSSLFVLTVTGIHALAIVHAVAAHMPLLMFLMLLVFAGVLAS